jgi:hypothetical protein
MRVRISSSRGGDAEGVELGLVEGEGGRGFGGDEDFAEDDFLAGFGELAAEPDAEGDEDDGAVDFERVLDDEELVLGPPFLRRRTSVLYFDARFVDTSSLAGAACHCSFGTIFGCSGSPS